jgi:tetratricopeptide (TPR) repeat protein
MEQQATANLGEVVRREGKYEEAVARSTKAVTLSQAIGDRDAEAGALGNLGLALISADRSNEAEEPLQRCLVLARELRNRSTQAMAYGCLGTIAFDRGRRAEAARLFSRAAKLREDEHDRHFVEALASLIEALASLGRNGELQTVTQQLVTVSDEIHAEEVAAYGISQAAARVLARSGGDHDTAASMFATAIVISLAGVTNAESTDAEKAEAYAHALADPIGYLVVCSRNLLDDEARSFFHLVLRQLADGYGSAGKMLRPYVKELINAAEDQLISHRDQTAPDSGKQA